jgi:hypothetical protein
MFHSEMFSRAVHADRVRDLERAARDHRLLADAVDERRTPDIGSVRTPVRSTSDATATSDACGRSAGAAA